MNKEENRLYQREWARKKRAQLNKAGLCSICKTADAVKDRKSCQPCLQKNSAKNRIKQARWKEHNRCARCVSRQARPNRVFCAQCAIVVTAKQRPLKLQRHAERLAAGMCVRCGKEPQLETLTPEAKQRLCERCYLRHLASHNLGNGVHWHILKDKLINQEFRCAYSGVPLILGVNASVDHIFPIARFPELKHKPDNVEWVDIKVNHMKRDHTPTEYIALIQRILEHHLL